MKTKEKTITNFAPDADQEALKQFESCYKEAFVTAAALMPDAHSGYAAPIGAVLITKDYIVPAWVGYDIGCGLIAVKIKGKNVIKKVKENSDKIYLQVKKKVSMGAGEYNSPDKVTDKTKVELKRIIETFEKDKYNKDILSFIKNSSLKHVGTLGGGNHFIELGVDEKEKDLWLIIHSGSRGLGYKVAEKYMIQAAGKSNKDKTKKKDIEKTFPLETKSQLGKEYLNVLNFGLEFALLNRMEMAYQVVNVIKEVLKDESIKFELWTNKNHNHAIPEKDYYIHRKGATPAKKGERGIIPANMRDGSFLVEGLGNKKFLESSSHGAGRVLSRTKARETITIKEFQDSMKGITGTVIQEVIDEAPMAYKNIFSVMDLQKDSVKTLHHIKPIINWKGK